MGEPYINRNGEFMYRNEHAYSKNPKDILKALETIKDDDLLKKIKEVAPELAKKIENTENLQGTEAGQMAQKLDAADGKKDGKISASVWNKYAKEHGGKTIKNEISVEDAMNSITKYSVEEQIEAKKAKAKELKESDAEALQQAKEAQADYEAGRAKENIESNSNNFGL